MSIPTYRKATQVTAINTLFGAFEAGTYEVHTAFPNPYHKKNATYGIDGKETIGRGTQFRVKRISNEDTGPDGAVIRWERISIRNLTLNGFGVVEAGYTEAKGANITHFCEPGEKLGMGDRKNLRFVELFCQNATRLNPTFGDSIGEYFCSQDALAMLIEQGTLTIEQVMNASKAAGDLDAGNDTDFPNLRAFRKRHGLG